jgi:hypothetical protein
MQRWLIAAGVGAAMLLAAAPAGAVTTLYASPTGDDAGGTNACTASASPCTIRRAVEIVPPDPTGEDVVLLPGTYNLTDTLIMPNTFVNPQITLRGVPDSPRPTINITGHGPSGAGVYVRGTLQDVNVTVPADVNAPYRAVTIEDGNDMVERVYVHTGNGSACALSGTIRDSVCWTSAVGAVAADLGVGPGFTVSAAMENVTAVASGTDGVGVQAFAGGATSSASITATNVIAHGANVDVQADAAQATSAASVLLDHSNYLSTNTLDNGTITTPGSGSNQTVAPVFADQANGDFRQTRASTSTLDLGTATGIGPTDLDGQPRTRGPLPDIGADELANFTSTAVSCSPASLALGSGSTTCTATVTDTDQVAPLVPTGNVSLNSSDLGNFTPAGACVLVQASLTQSSCQLTFTPFAVATHQIAAAFSGNADQDRSQGTTALPVSTAIPPGGGITNPAPPPAKKKCKKRKHRAAAAKKCKKKRKK